MLGAMTVTVTRTAPPARLSRRARKSLVVLHVVASVGWLGVTFGNLVLGVTARDTGDPAVQKAIYLVLGVIGPYVLLPLALTATVTGVVLGLGTPWGLFRTRWVHLKLWLTVVPLLLTVFLLLPGIREAADVAAATAPRAFAEVEKGGIDLVIPPCVSGTLYLASTVLSVFKPRLGRVRTAAPSARRS